MVLDAPELLSDGAATWRRALDTLRLLWVPDPAALARRAPRLLCADLAGPACVASRLVLQYSFGLPAAAVYERLPGSALAPPEELACRLSFLEMQGLPVAAAAAGPEEGLAEGAAAAAISLEEVAALPERTLLQRLEQLAAACRQAWAGAAAFAAFRSSFQQRPEWAHLQAEAAAESARLQRLLRGA